MTAMPNFKVILSFLLSLSLSLPPAQASWPKLIISIDPLQSEKPFLITHNPPLPEGAKVNLSASELSLELLLKQCVLERSHTHLRGLKAVLNGTGWHKHGILLSLLSLSLALSLSIYLSLFLLTPSPPHPCCSCS